MERHRVAIRRVTVVLLATSVVLILPSLAGIGSSVPFAVGLVLVGLSLAGVQGELAAAPTVLGYDLGRYAPDLWVAVFLAVTVLVAVPDATAAELQSLGGVVGFVAMVNYFLTPVYGAIYALAVRARRTLAGA